MATELSPRQREVLALVAAGRTSKEIAGQLGISESTVNWHISNVFARLGASSRAEAVALAMREEAQRADDQEVVPVRRAGRPSLPLSSVALAVAVTLVLGLFGGALLAGWDFTSPTSPSSSASPSGRAPQSAEPTVRPTGVHAPRPDVDVTSPDGPTGAPSTSMPAAQSPLPFGAPALEAVIPAPPTVPPVRLP